MTTRQCPTCPADSPKPLTPVHFYRNGNGFTSRCSSCLRAEKRDHDRRNRGKSVYASAYPMFAADSEWWVTRDGKTLRFVVASITINPYHDIVVCGKWGGKRTAFPAKWMKANAVAVDEKGAA